MLPRVLSLLDFFLPDRASPFCARARDAGAHAALVDALRAFPAAHDAAERCCMLLYHLLSGTELTARQLAADDDACIMDALVAALRAHAAPPSLCHIAAAAMCELLSRPTGARLRADSVSALPALVAMMRAWPAHAELQDAGCAVLAHVAAAGGGGDAADEAGAFAAVTRALRGFPSDVRLQRHGCDTLVALAARAPRAPWQPWWRRWRRTRARWSCSRTAATRCAAWRR
jgi:hypothetical protein